MRSFLIFMLCLACAPSIDAKPVQAKNPNALSMDALENCYAFSQVEIRSCLRELNVASEKQLLQTYLLANNAIKKWDEDAKYKTLAQKNLTTSQTAFVKYRQAQCTYEASLGGGAIGLETLRLRCTFLQNKQRIETIQNSLLRFADSVY